MYFRDATVRERCPESGWFVRAQAKHSLTVVPLILILSIVRGADCFALSGLGSEAVLSTQGGAAMCPGLICSGPFGANCAAARSRLATSLQFTALPCGVNQPADASRFAQDRRNKFVSPMFKRTWATRPIGGIDTNHIARGLRGSCCRVIMALRGIRFLRCRPSVRRPARPAQSHALRHLLQTQAPRRRRPKCF